MAEISGLVLPQWGMSPSQVARDSLDILSRDGWCKWTTTKWTTAMSPGAIIAMTHDRKASFLSFPEGSHCLGGAMNLVLTGCAEFWCDNALAYDAAASVIMEQYPQRWDGLGSGSIITYFNDLNETTEADVRRILEKVAAG
jgi:hypothetical protein